MGSSRCVPAWKPGVGFEFNPAAVLVGQGEGDNLGEASCYRGMSDAYRKMHDQLRADRNLWRAEAIEQEVQTKIKVS